MKLRDAEDRALSLCDDLAKYCHRAAVAGSVRREAEEKRRRECEAAKRRAPLPPGWVEVMREAGCAAAERTLPDGRHVRVFNQPGEGGYWKYRWEQKNPASGGGGHGYGVMGLAKACHRADEALGWEADGN